MSLTATLQNAHQTVHRLTLGKELAMNELAPAPRASPGRRSASAPGALPAAAAVCARSKAAKNAAEIRPVQLIACKGAEVCRGRGCAQCQRGKRDYWRLCIKQQPMIPCQTQVWASVGLRQDELEVETCPMLRVLRPQGLQIQAGMAVQSWRASPTECLSLPSGCLKFQFRSVKTRRKDRRKVDKKAELGKQSEGTRLKTTSSRWRQGEEEGDLKT